VTDEHDQTAIATATVLVLADATPVPPTATFTFGPPDPAEGTTVLFDATGSRDADGRIVEYAWDFDDDGLADFVDPRPSANHAFVSAGLYPVTLRVTDDDGQVGSSTVNVPVRPATAPELQVRVVRTGSVTSDPAGIACSNADFDPFVEVPCQAAFSVERVTLTAVPELSFGNTHTRWSGDCESTSSNVCVVRMGGRARSVRACFYDGSARGLSVCGG
jgi:hypothetical protein